MKTLLNQHERFEKESAVLAKRLFSVETHLKKLWAALIVLSMAIVALVVYLTGGTAYIWTHLMYIPLVGAAAAFGLKGGVVAGIAAGLILGPTMPLQVASETSQPLNSWIFRTIFFTISGGLCGFLFDHLKRYLLRLSLVDYIDAPSGLPNYLALQKLLNQAYQHQPASGTQLLLAILDVINANEVIDTIGYPPVIEMMPQIIGRLRLPEFANISLFRILPNRFAVLADSLDLKQFIGTIKEMLKRFEKPVYADKIPIMVDFRAGIALPQTVSSADELIQKAGAASHQAAVDGSTITIYDQQKDVSSVEILSLLGSLNKAIEDRELTPFFQPKVELSSNRAVGAEMLIRWIHPQKGLVPASRYIAHAEKTWLVHPLSKFAVESTVKYLQTWQSQGVDVKLSVNLTAQNLQKKSFMEDVIEQIKASGIDPSGLEIEITERTMVTQYEIVSRTVTQLREMGVSISIDDFGTGYSTVGLLAKLAVDYIKIDKKYIRDITSSPLLFSFVRRIIQTAGDLGIKSIAEGVESKKVFDTLGEIGCTIAQGYYISPPLPSYEFLPWMQRYNDEPL
ncbi:MAG: EAL domain-containing protein [Desulfobacteraceae bacterium]|nr:EAL domain-containing protein [Desulfobacteraceae bacterium]